MAKVGTCTKCGQEKEIRARGMCGSCYVKAQRNKEFTPDPKRRRKSNPRPGPEKPGNPPDESAGVIVSVTFAPRDAGIYDKLSELAQTERRNPGQQILCILDNHFNADPAEPQEAA